MLWYLDFITTVKGLPLASVLSWFSPVHIFTTHSVQYILILSLCPDQNFTRISSLSMHSVVPLTSALT